MPSVIKNLCWKEFHELKWGTASAAAIVLAIPLCYVFRDYSMAFMGVHTGLWIYPVLAGIFFGMRAAAGERTNRTGPFIASLPISVHVLGTVRLIAAIVAAGVPIVGLLSLGAILAPLAEHTRDSMMPLAAVAGWSALGSACCFLIVAVAGLGQPTEIRAGAVGFVAILCTWIAGVGVLIVIDNIMPFFIHLVVIEAPNEERRVQIEGAFLAGALAVFLACVFTARYCLALEELGDPTPRRSIGAFVMECVSAFRLVLRQFAASLCAFVTESARAANVGLRSPLAALMWKGIREAGVLGLLVLLGSLLLSVAGGALGQLENDISLIEGAANSLPFVLLAGGFIVAILVGVGAAIGDVQPGVNTFWRSRPISARAWYWTKYGVGLATMFVAVEIPFLFCAAVHDLDVTENQGVFWWLLIWNVTFSFAITATCLVRQPAHAAILAMGAAGILYAVVQAMFGSFWPGDHQAPMEILVPVFLVAFAISTFVGSWAAEHDVAIS